MQIRSLGQYLLIGLETMGLYALYSTQEFDTRFFFFAIFLALIATMIRRWFKNNFENRGLIPDFLLLIIFILSVAGTLFFYLYSDWHPVILAGTVTPIFHSLLWLQKSDIRNRSFRLGMSFISLVLATHISPELYIALIVFTFMVIASVAISCLFLEREFNLRAPLQLKKPLPKNFISQSFSLAMVVFVCSLVLFPILPRPKFSGHSQWGSERMTGYSEKVDLQGWSKFSGSGEGPVVIRALLPENSKHSEVAYWFPHQLLKGMTLDRFNGVQWLPYHSQKKDDETAELSRTLASNNTSKYELFRLEFVREAIGSSILPIPYGTQFVDVDSQNWRQRAKRLSQGSWILPMSEKERIKYNVVQAFRQNQKDLPQSHHLELPTLWQDKRGRWNMFAEKIFAGTSHTSDKFNRLRNYFKELEFKASTNPGENQIIGVSGTENSTLKGPEKTKAYLDSFMFSARSGHCELYASASALLLRMNGVPARVVAGFRASTESVGGMVSIKEGDAHAWVEAWDQYTGWIVFDPTPAQYTSRNTWLDKINQFKDLVFAYWYKYFLRFDHETQSELKDKTLGLIKKSFRELNRRPEPDQERIHQVSHQLLLVFTLLIFAAIAYALRKRMRSPQKKLLLQNFNSERLNRELLQRRSKMDKLIDDLGYTGIDALLEKHSSMILSLDNPPQWYLGILRWKFIDECLRFGAQGPGSETWDQQITELDGIWDNYQEAWDEKLIPYNDKASEYLRA